MDLRDDPVPWPLAFSTLGCPDARIAEVVRLAARHNVRHIELRVHDDGPVTVGSSPAVRNSVRKELAAADLSVVSLSSYIELAAVTTREVIDIALRHLELADDLGCGAIRVFTGGPGDPDTSARARDRLAAILEASPGSSVRLLIETHDHMLSGADVVHALGPDLRAGAVWDILNTWRAGEAPAATAAALSGRIGLVQIKDVASLNELTPVLPGDGVLPLVEVLASLAEEEWQGVLSLEWERAWYPALADLDTAIPVAQRYLRQAWSTYRDKQ